MAVEPLPLSKVAKTLESATGYDFQVILKTLTSFKYVDDKLLKSDLAVLVAKILKLLRSSDDYHVWKACHLTEVICAYNPVVLCSQAGVLLTALFSKLEQKAGFYRTTVSTPQGKTVLFTLVKSVGVMVDLVRGKPALTREILTPRLPAIISILITLSQFEPKLCCPILKKLLTKNTTTFRPHINKFKNVLINLIAKDYHHFDDATKKLIVENFALLNLVKQNSGPKDETKSHLKTYQDEQWRQSMMSVLYNFKPIINLCGEIIDFSADRDMQDLVQRLPSPPSGEFEEFLPPVNVDLNKPMSLWQIAERLRILCDLTVAFTSQHTKYQIRVPLGGIVTISEAILSLTTNYLPLQRTLRRDAELTSTVGALLPTLQASGMTLLGSMSQLYGKMLLSYTPSILATLEFFIPSKKGSTSIDLEKVDCLRSEFFDLFGIVNLYLSHLGHSLNETTLFTKLVEIALHLTKDSVPLKHLYLQQNLALRKTSEKSKKASKQNTGSMSDVYSHPQAFISTCSLKHFDSLNRFLTGIVLNLKMPSVQQIKITKYAITAAVKLERELGQVPESFVHLLRALVMHPGYERISIIPIAVTLLKKHGDDVFDVFCNPRLPIGAVQTVNRQEQSSLYDDHEEEIDFSHEAEEEGEITTVNEDTKPEPEEIEKAEAPNVVLASNMERILNDEPDKMFRKRTIEVQSDDHELKIRKTEIEQEVEVTKSIPVEVVQESETVVEVHESDVEDDSDFEIPDINLSDDEE